MGTTYWHVTNHKGTPLCQIPPALKRAGGVCEFESKAEAEKAAVKASKGMACPYRVVKGECPKGGEAAN